MQPLFVFEDIMVPDVEDLLPNEEPEKADTADENKGVWNSGQKENIWRGVDPKDIWTADPDGTAETETDENVWDAGAPEQDTEERDQDMTTDDRSFGDILT